MSKELPIRKKCKRYNTPGHGHEITFSCYKQQKLLSNPVFCEFLAEAIISAKEKHSFGVLAYVFMPEHVHLVIIPEERDYSISKILNSIKQSSSQKSMKHIKKNQPEMLEKLSTGQKKPEYSFWMPGGGYDRNITKEETLINMMRYIHNNPVKRGLVEYPEDWKWSSAKFWNDRSETPVPVDEKFFPVL